MNPPMAHYPFRLVYRAVMDCAVIDVELTRMLFGPTLLRCTLTF